MSDTEYLRRRITATNDLHKVVKMMKSLALANIRRNEQAVEAMQAHSRAVQLGLQALLSRHPMPSVTTRKPGTGLIIFGTDQGMCGAFNERLAEYASHLIDNLEAQSHNTVDVVVIGVRLRDALLERGYETGEALESAITVDGARHLVRGLLPGVEAWQTHGRSRVSLVWNRPEGPTHWTPVSLEMLPLDEVWLEQTAHEPWPRPGLPGWSLDDEALFAALVREYLVMTLFRAAVESLSAENASRLAAMQAAERSIGEKLDELEARLRQERQTAITLELLDLIGGFEALTADS